MRARTWYSEGIKRIAEENGVSIPEAVLIGLTPTSNNVVTPEVVDDTIDAYRHLNPGALYVQGLRAMSNVTEVLRGATKVAVGQAEEVHADEHIAPITAAFRFLTGQKFSRTP